MEAGSLCWQLHFKLIIRLGEEAILPRLEPWRIFFLFLIKGSDAQLWGPVRSQLTGHFLQAVGWSCQAPWPRFVPPWMEANRGQVWVCSLLPEIPPMSKPWWLGLLVKAGLSSSASGVRRPHKSRASIDLKHTIPRKQVPISDYLRVHEGQAHRLSSSPNHRLSGQMTGEQPPRQNIKACSCAFLTEPIPRLALSSRNIRPKYFFWSLLLFFLPL